MESQPSFDLQSFIGLQLGDIESEVLQAKAELCWALCESSPRSSGDRSEETRSEARSKTHTSTLSTKSTTINNRESLKKDYDLQTQRVELRRLHDLDSTNKASLKQKESTIERLEGELREIHHVQSSVGAELMQKDMELSRAKAALVSVCDGLMPGLQDQEVEEINLEEIIKVIPNVCQEMSTMKVNAALRDMTAELQSCRAEVKMLRDFDSASKANIEHKEWELRRLHDMEDSFRTQIIRGQSELSKAKSALQHVIGAYFPDLSSKPLENKDLEETVEMMERGLQDASSAIRTETVELVTLNQELETQIAAARVEISTLVEQIAHLERNTRDLKDREQQLMSHLGVKDVQTQKLTDRLKFVVHRNSERSAWQQEILEVMRFAFGIYLETQATSTKMEASGSPIPGVPNVSLYRVPKSRSKKGITTTRPKAGGTAATPTSSSVYQFHEFNPVLNLNKVPVFDPQLPIIRKFDHVADPNAERILTDGYMRKITQAFQPDFNSPAQPLPTSIVGLTSRSDTQLMTDSQSTDISRNKVTTIATTASQTEAGDGNIPILYVTPQNKDEERVEGKESGPTV